MAINLIDFTKFKFGSVEWQDAMRHNIIEKIKHKEDLGSAEICFVQVQKEHNYRICGGRK